MTKPIDIIETHRQDLIRRLLNRNPLLGFRPSSSSATGGRIDFHDLFSVSEIDSGNTGEPEQLLGFRPTTQGQIGFHDSSPAPDIDSGNTGDPKRFLQDIVKGGEAKIDMSHGSMKKFLAPLRRLKLHSLDNFRATGSWSLCLGWPLVLVPGQGAMPRCAPLLLWKIQIVIDGQKARFSLREEGAEFNFALQAWLSKEYKISLEWESDNNADDLSALEGKLERALAVWKECKNRLDFTKSIRKFEEEKFASDSPIVAPCAIIGQASFKSRRLLEELKKLKKWRERGDNFGLLNRLLVDAGERAQTSAAKEPQDESKKWLVSESDAAQERAIWQARLEEVMLIEGPPGTGKSQTIVNLIADAALRGNQVALICDKKPALDVVHERLKEAGLGNLTAQINEPAKDRSNFIQRVRDIFSQVDLPDAEERGQLSKAISESERICERASEKQGAAYSVRGHLRAQIHKAQESTGFDPFFEHAGVVSEFRGALGDKLDQAQSDNWIEKVESLVQNWQQCDYPDNPWRDIKEDWDRGKIPSLQAGISGMHQQYKNLAKKRQLLPHGAALALAENSLMGAHLAAFFAPPRREAAREFGGLIAGTRRAFDLAGLESPRLWRGVFDQNGESGYARYERTIGQIETIQRVHRLLRKNRCFRILANNFSDQVSDWPEILLAAICALRYKPSRVGVGEFNDALRQLERKIEEKRMLDRQEICRKYSSQTHVAEDLRRKELLRLRTGSGIPKTPLRSIYHDKAIWSVFPILLTSPAAASELLPLRPGTLDLVIIDEASQMFTADAMPIFYRAKRIVVSGDDKQMPPSDIINLGRDDDDSEYGDSEDDEPKKLEKGRASADGRFELLEVVGHFLLSRGKDARALLEVHYRSLPNELIDFSNHAFYGGKLQTAPSDVDLPECLGKRPICVIECGGTFENGVNQVEITRIVEKLREIWRTPNPPSVGVIAFNDKQAKALKGAIADDLDPAFRAAHEKAVGKDEEESDASFFVRGVESVQGDERDIIILGTTYGREHRNFGLFLHTGKGQRRLNVAITRAKKGMFVFTSLGENFSHHGESPPNPGENPTHERWYLWMYMRYARAISAGDRKAAERVLRELNPGYASFSTGKADSEFEIQVADFLRGKGYAVDYQIGESGFRIDLGVKKNASDVRYLCGVECDGRQYHSGWHARHNDIWRQDILEKKGWNIVRIWSDEWFNSSAGKENLLAEIRKLEPGETA